MALLPHSELPPPFLEDDPTPDRLLEAMTANMCLWGIRSAQSEGGEVRQEQGITWTSMPTSGRRGDLLFPQLDPLHASDQLDMIMDFYRQRLPLQAVLCWSLAPTQPADLEARLLARGFEWNWQPHWMWLDFRHMQTLDARPTGLHIEVVDEEPRWEADDLPSSHRELATSPSPMTRCRPSQVWHVAARLNDQVVGHCILNLTTGNLGVAGLFDMGVVPSVRNQGIGKALTVAACQFAQQMGCHHAVLNATEMGEPVYRRVGFASLGYGYTWLLCGDTLAASPLSQEQVAMAEAIGRGDISRLDELCTHLPASSYTATFGRGITLMQIAVKLKQPASASWLVEHGTPLDVLSAWDLGWKDRVPLLLAESPHLANARSGSWQITPLQSAVERGDTALARVLLTAHPDLELEDTAFHATALGWAQHFERTEIIELIEQYQEKARHA